MPKSFNLTQADKSRLEKLQNLIKNVSGEEAKEMNRYLDQLGDIWYDRADRAETLLQFSQAVDRSTTLTTELKSRIADQINLIYTEGDADAADKTLARTIISDFLAKSPGKKEIFGDGGEITGLINEIYDTPEAYENNKKIASRIYDEFVKFDTQISDEAKAIIEQKLTLLIGSPPV